MIVRLSHVVTVLNGSIAISGCLFFILTLLYPIFVNGDTQLHNTIRNYLLSNQSTLIGVAQLTALEERHLLDVKHVFQTLKWLTLVTSALTIAGLVLLAIRTKIIRHIGQSGLVYISLIAINSFLFGFRNNFIELHYLLFLPDTWWFGSESTLIRLYPLSFFQEFVLIYLTLATLIFSCCWWFNRN